LSRINLGILQVNHDRSIEVGDAFPDDSHRFRDLFDTMDDRFRYRIYMTIGGELPESLDEQDAFMVTGSPLSVLDRHIFTDDLMAFIRRCDESKKPLMGACFGHQAIALALGGKVERSDNSYNVGIEETTFHQKRPWMNPDRDSLPMYVFHEDQVTELPDDCDVIGSTPNCRISSFAKGNHIFTTQSHPEFTNPFMSCVLRYTEPKMSDAKVKAAWDSIENEEHGRVFGEWSTNFFKGTHK